MSASLEIDELESDRLFQMNQMEFYEALARVAEKLSLPQYGLGDVLQVYHNINLNRKHTTNDSRRVFTSNWSPP